MSDWKLRKSTQDNEREQLNKIFVAIDAAIAAGGGGYSPPIPLADLAQEGALTGQTLTWDGTQYSPATPASGVTDHGLLSGLADDDHTQYFNATRLAAYTGFDARYFTETESDARYAPLSHTHTTSQITDLSSYTGLDVRYYTETEVDSLLAGKADTSHTHVIADVTGLQAALDSKQAALTSSTSNTISGTQVQRAALTGDVTASANSNATTIADNAVTNAKLANVATSTIKGRATAGTGDPEDLTAAQVRTLLNVADGATANTGTVTSVALSVPTGLSVAGSPITTSGTFTVTYGAGFVGYTTAEQTKLSGITAGAVPNTVVTVTDWDVDTNTAAGTATWYSGLGSATNDPSDNGLIAMEIARSSSAKFLIGGAYAADELWYRRTGSGPTIGPWHRVWDDGNTLAIGTSATSARAALLLGTAATQDIGQSGANVPRMSFANTWSADQTVSDSRLHSARTSAGYPSVSQTMDGVLLTSGGMNTTSKYTNPLMFGSTDPDLTTTNPKIGAMVVGYATEAYSTDTTGGMGLEFFTTPNGPGAAGNLTSTVVLTTTTFTYNGNSVWHAGNLLDIGTTASSARTALALGTAATKNTGTAGATIPLLNAANFWTGAQEFAGTAITVGDIDTEDSTLYGRDGTIARKSGAVYTAPTVIWHAGNDGAGSTLDADLLDAQHGTYYLARANHSGTQTASTISDFNSASRAQTEAMLIAGTNITLTTGSSGATRTLTIAASGGGGGGATWLRQAANVANSTVTSANTDLQFSATANTRYMLKGYCRYTSVASTTAVRPDITAPSGATVFGRCANRSSASVGTDSEQVGVWTASNTQIAFTTAITTNGWLEFWAIVEVGGTAGTVGLRFASEIATSSVQILAGSVMSYEVLP